MTDEHAVSAERAANVFVALVATASHRQTITYERLAEAVDSHPRALRFPLGYVQKYCKARRLPPLTALCVSKHSGLPGEGMTESSALTAAEDREKVFAHTWLQDSIPTVADFEAVGWQNV